MKPRELIGRQLAGKYTLESLLGVGGFGAVYRARQAPIDRIVAVKVSLHPHRTDLQARFVREARLQAELRHPACVMLLDCGETEGLFYLVQEFVNGRSLKAALAGQPMAPDRVIEFACQVLGALGEAHRHHIVHRDIKPANVMLTRGADDREEVRVLDFGIAKLLISSDEDTESLTGTGMSLGTPAYMAPEQIRPGTIGPPTDVYAVGAMVFRMLAGRPVFTGATIDVLTQQLNAVPPPLPAGLAMFDPIIARAMAKAPEDRFQTAAEMAAALRSVRLAGAWSGHMAPVGQHPADDLLDQTLVTPPRQTVAVEQPPPRPAPPPHTPAPEAGATTPTPDPRGSRVAAISVILLLVLVGVGLGLWVALPGTEASAPDAAAPPAVVVDAAAPDALIFDAVARAEREPDAAVPDAAPPDAAPIDAAPAPPIRRRRRTPARPRPEPLPERAPDSPTLLRRFESELKACRCADARQTLATLRGRVGEARAKPLAAKHEAACVLFIPGNCQTR